MSRRAVILAGGKGTRLRPYTIVLPKPLMPIGDFPILEVIVRQLAQHGFDHVTMAVNHQAELIRAFFQDGKKWNLKIDYSLEDEPLGTMGPLKLIQDLPENFLVMNGDVLTDLDFRGFHDKHVTDRRLFTISSRRRLETIDYGVLETDERQRLVKFKEKPKTEFNVSMGVYMVRKDVLAVVPPGKQYGFDMLMLDMLGSGREVVVREFDGYWLDIGRPDDYLQAIDEFESMRSRFLNE